MVQPQYVLWPFVFPASILEKSNRLFTNFFNLIWKWVNINQIASYMNSERPHCISLDQQQLLSFVVLILNKLLQRSHNQGQWSSELVWHVWKEDSFCIIDHRQRFRSFSFSFVDSSGGYYYQHILNIFLRILNTLRLLWIFQSDQRVAPRILYNHRHTLDKDWYQLSFAIRMITVHIWC